MIQKTTKRTKFRIKKTSRDKKTLQGEHFDQRCLLRLGYILSDDSKIAIIDSIRSGRASLVQKSSERVKIYAVTHNNVSFHVVYDSKRQQLVTVLLPTEAVAI